MNYSRIVRGGHGDVEPSGDDSLSRGAEAISRIPEMGLTAAASLEVFPYRGSRYVGDVSGLFTKDSIIFPGDESVPRPTINFRDDELKASSTVGPSSLGSTEPWDTSFNRATNKYKNKDLSKTPTSAGHVSGFGTSMKLSEYYGSDAKTRRQERRSSSKDKYEVQDLKKKVESLEKLVAEKPAENTELMNKLLDEKIRQIIPLG
ncbi:hypothetical protein QYE76_035651 [Lolium multiflorum]|uniref:Uncharacterized protein n=1 Tax=Lolium multiflorum TaxID=4521 RepID=A0AAD8QZL9_LOLMU|nr:hypothetical protein QYE76_035651 [Lolium multiflorum]